MKALKYSGFKRNAFLATSLATTLGCLGIYGVGISVATAQSDTSTDIKVDIEACQALNDSTALDQESIKTRIACYSRDVEHLNKLVNQLMSERDELVATAESQNASIEEYKQELANRQDAMQRLEERAAELRLQIDEITTERNQVREQLFDVIAKGKEQPIEVAANKRLFENFSESYVTLSNEIEELRKQLDGFENSNTELSDENLAANIENQQLQTTNKALSAQIESLEASVADLESEKEDLQTRLDTANSEIETIQTQLLVSEELAKQSTDEVARLQAALDESESQRSTLESTIASINKQHLQEVTALNSRTDELSAQIDALNEQQLTLENQSKQASDELQSTVAARDAEIEQLNSAKKELNAERENLIAQMTALEKSHFEQTQTFKDNAIDLENQIATLTTEKSELDKQLQDQKSANDELKAYARESNDKSEELNLAANELREQLGAADTKAEALQANIDQLGQDSAKLKADFTEQVASLNETIEQNQQERDTLAAELDTVKPKLQTAEDNLRSSEQQNTELTASVASLEQQLATAAEEQESLKSTLMAAQEQGQQASENLATLKENAATLTTLLSMSKAHSENADATLTQLRMEMEEADARLKAKQDELEALLAEKTSIEDKFKAMANKTKSQAQAIEESLMQAGHESVKVAARDDNTIGILLGSGQLFRTGSARLSEDGQQVLRDLAKTFSLADDRRIMINGHSDNVPLGPKLAELYKDNWGLSMARALATANFFADEAGIPADRMTVSGFGATKPIADNETAEGRQLNRRVEISLVPADETVASAE